MNAISAVSRHHSHWLQSLRLKNSPASYPLHASLSPLALLLLLFAATTLNSRLAKSSDISPSSSAMISLKPTLSNIRGTALDSSTMPAPGTTNGSREASPYLQYPSPSPAYMPHSPTPSPLLFKMELTDEEDFPSPLFRPFQLQTTSPNSRSNLIRLRITHGPILKQSRKGSPPMTPQNRNARYGKLTNSSVIISLKDYWIPLRNRQKTWNLPPPLPPPPIPRSLNTPPLPPALSRPTAACSPLTT
jgi:hypothetical protein